MNIAKLPELLGRGCCHCRWCQRETGTVHALNALYEADRLVHTAGEPEIVLTPSASGRGQKIARCPTCRVAVWSNYPQAGPAIRFVRVGTMDNPDLCPPDIHIYTSSKPASLPRPGNLPSRRRAAVFDFDALAEHVHQIDHAGAREWCRLFQFVGDKRPRRGVELVGQAPQATQCAPRAAACMSSPAALQEWQSGICRQKFRPRRSWRLVRRGRGPCQDW